jgi:hypothetical protein
MLGSLSVFMLFGKVTFGFVFTEDLAIVFGIDFRETFDFDFGAAFF